MSCATTNLATHDGILAYRALMNREDVGASMTEIDEQARVRRYACNNQHSPCQWERFWHKPVLRSLQQPDLLVGCHSECRHHHMQMPPLEHRTRQTEAPSTSVESTWASLESL